MTQQQQSDLTTIENPLQHQNELLFQATGFLVGALVKDESDRYKLITRNGELQVRGAHSGLLAWLSYNPNRTCGLWIIYPQTSKDAELASVYVHSYCQYSIKSDNPFRIAGRVIYDRENKIGVKIERNIQPPKGREIERKFKPFNVTLQGCLPEKAIGQFWKIEADLVDNKLTLVDAVKLAERTPFSREVIKRDKAGEENVAA